MSAKDGVLPFTIEVVEDDASLTAHAGLPIVLETMRALSLSEGLTGNSAEPRRFHPTRSGFPQDRGGSVEPDALSAEFPV